MKYYIQSAGKNKEHEYSWIHLGSDNSSSKPESILNNIKRQGVYIESCFLIIARDEDEKGHDGYLFLLIKLDSKYADYQGRKILNYIAVKSENDEDDHLIQALSSELLGNFEKIEEINALIKPDDNSPGFKINESEFIKKLKTIAEYNTRKLKTDHQTCIGKIAKDSDNKRAELAEKIITQLPDKNKGVLVLISDSISLETINRIDHLFCGLIGNIGEDYWDYTLSGRSNEIYKNLQECNENMNAILNNFKYYNNDNKHPFIKSKNYEKIKNSLDNFQEKLIENFKETSCIETGTKSQNSEKLNWKDYSINDVMKKINN